MSKPTQPLSAAMPSDLKIKNRMQILEVFLRGGEYSANDVAALTGISRQTVMKAVQFFCGRGLIRPAGKGDSTDIGGKKPILFAFSYQRRLLCITMWPGSLILSLLDMRASLIGRAEYRVELPKDAEGFFAQVGEYAARLLQENGVGKSELYGVSLSTAGTVNYRTNRLKYSSLSPEWGTDVPVADYLRRYVCDTAVIFVENAGKMTARSLLLDESLLDKRVLVLFTTWGLSACLIDKGHILSGKDSLIGEVGHMVVDPSDPERCGCGSYGCIERLVSEERVRCIVGEGIGRHPDSALGSIPAEALTLRDVFAASSQSDPYAREIVARLARLFALTLRNITLVFDPNLVVFQGDYAGADHYFDEKLRESLGEFQYYPPGGAFEIRYDKRSLFELDVIGSSNSLIRYFFKDPALYTD